MCGIVAMISTAPAGFFSNDLEVFEQMLYIDALRGPDSTGAFSVQRNQQVQGFKHAAPPMVSMTTNGWYNFRREAVQSGRILVGHNRKATHGSINNENSHPFYEDHIVLVHNGTLWNHKNKLADRDVDSHAFAAALSQTEPDSVPQLIADQDGAYAFVWWDMEQKKLFFVRNKERPLNMIRYNERIVLCSEAWMGLGCIQRNVRGLSTTQGDPKALRYWEVEAGKLFSLTMDGTLASEEIPAKKVVAVSSGTGTQTASTTSPATKTTATGTASTGTNGERTPYFNTVKKDEVVVPFNTKGTIPGIKGGELRIGERVFGRVDRVVDISGSGARRAWFRAMGVITQIGKPAFDFTVRLPDNIDVGDIQDWVGKTVQGRVMRISPDLVAGPSCQLTDVKLIGEQRSIRSNNNIFLSEEEWEYVEANCCCDYCNAKVMPFEREFTNVKVDQKAGKLDVMCADCIESRMQNQEVKERFTANRIAAMDAWVPKQEKAHESKVIQLPGPSTLQ